MHGVLLNIHYGLYLEWHIFFQLLYALTQTYKWVCLYKNYILVNPQRACSARVTVVVLCICMYVCMCVCPLIPAASHIGITKERYQRILRNTGIVLNFADFPKNALFKSYGVICLPRAAPAS